MAIAVAVVVAILAVLILVFGGNKPIAPAAPINAQPDPYASHLAITNIAMSQSSNMAGNQLTYLDGHIANDGDRTVTGIQVQVLFRDAAHQVAQNETLPMRLIRTREPYVDLEPISAAPLKPGEGQDFRLIFDTLTKNWDGAYPQIRILRVDTR